MAMQPTAVAECGVTDFLERILDKGMVIHADLIVSLAGVPLVGVSLKAAIAGMETMLKYGMLVDWDEKTRDWERKERDTSRKGKVPLLDGEEVLVKAFGAHWYSRGIYRNWRPGQLYVTDRRVLLWRALPAEVLLDIPYELMRGMAAHRRMNVAGKETEYLHILLKDGEVAGIQPADFSAVKEAIERRMKTLGLKLERCPTIPLPDEGAGRFLAPGEGVTHCGRMWHLMRVPSSGSAAPHKWKPGHLCLTNRRLYWYHDFDGRLKWEVPIDSLIHATCRTDNVSGALKGKQVLSVLYTSDSENRVACFSGQMVEMKNWEDALSDIIRQRDDTLPDDWETCPRCEKKASRLVLLRESCPSCGWTSPRVRRAVHG
ncbi:gas vesicle protein GvpJ [Chloroflexota bacterium]